MRYSLDDKIQVLSRELAMRRRVYGRQVNEGRMQAQTADREIGVMEEILNEYQAQKNKVEPSLFDLTEGGEE